MRFSPSGALPNAISAGLQCRRTLVTGFGRVAKLVVAGRISAEQGEKFLAERAVGSHLENIQRNEGYKGFNRKNVTTIIQQTDPRK